MNPIVNKRQIITFNHIRTYKYEVFMSFWLVFMSWMANCYIITVSFNMDDEIAKNLAAILKYAGK